jgi:hypothetical protein
MPTRLQTVVSHDRGITWSVLCSELRNSTNLGITPHSITRSIGGFRSFDRILRNLAVDKSWSSTLLEKTPATICGNSSKIYYQSSQKDTHLSIQGSILVVRLTCFSLTRIVFLELGIEVPSFGEVFLFLLLSDFDLLIFPASTQFITSKLVLAFVLLTAMFRYEASRVAHDDEKERIVSISKLMMRIVLTRRRLREKEDVTGTLTL